MKSQRNRNKQREKYSSPLGEQINGKVGPVIPRITPGNGFIQLAHGDASNSDAARSDKLQCDVTVRIA
jgi:hypothetical protein